MLRRNGFEDLLMAMDTRGLPCCSEHAKHLTMLAALCSPGASHESGKLYPKCDLGPTTYDTATDLNAWWPGRSRWEACERRSSSAGSSGSPLLSGLEEQAGVHNRRSCRVGRRNAKHHPSRDLHHRPACVPCPKASLSASGSWWPRASSSAVCSRGLTLVHPNHVALLPSPGRLHALVGNGDEEVIG